MNLPFTSFTLTSQTGSWPVASKSPQRQGQGGFDACARMLCLLLLLTSIAWQAAAQGKIAFSFFYDGNKEIYVMNADGTNPTHLTNAVGDDDFPSWRVAANSAFVTALSSVRKANAAPRTTKVAVTLSKNWAAGPAVTVWSGQAGGKKAGTATASGNGLFLK